MPDKTSRLLTEGLIKGYAGQNNVSTVTRGTFIGKSSHWEPVDGIYHDEWYVPTHLGGGQELVKADDEVITRLYGGGTPNPEELANLGLTVKDVGKYLKDKIVSLGDKTRLYEDYKPDPDGDWRYVYEITLRDPKIPVTVGIESIYYKDVRVHLHPFILSPLK